MIYHFLFYPYQRQFKVPLQTYHGTWSQREGIIIHLTNANGKVGKGEIAPLPWFGSECLAEAMAFCQGVGETISETAIFSIPDTLRACQFAFASAWGELSSVSSQPSKKLNFSYLLPAGKEALNILRQNLDKGCYKWKIGVYGLKDELAIFPNLLELLPESALLRLDANGGLSVNEAREWLKQCSHQIEFMEQPLGVDELPAMLQLAEEFTIPLALDESVANLQQLQDCYQQGWRGIFIVKAAIFGYPHLLRQFCQEYKLDTVFSSVLETAIARQAALQLAEEVMIKDRALGFGVDHWFKD